MKLLKKTKWTVKFIHGLAEEVAIHRACSEDFVPQELSGDSQILMQQE